MANLLAWLTGREDQTGQPPPFAVDDGRPSLRAYNPTPSERVGNWIQDLLMSGGAQAYPAGHVAHGVKDLLSMSPLGIGMSAADLLHAKSAGDPMGAAAAAIGMVPGAGGLGREVGPAIKASIAKSFPAKTGEETLSMIEAALAGKPYSTDTGFLANQPVVTSQKHLNDDLEKLFAEMLGPAKGKAAPAQTSSYWDWKPEEVAALKKQKPMLDYATDHGSGTVHVFDAVTGKTLKEGFASHAQAQDYIKQAENFYKPAIKPAPINNIQEQFIDPPHWENKIPAKPPWLNQSDVLPEDARQAARLAGDYTTPVYRGIRLPSATDDFGTVFKGGQHFSTASPELADMYSSYLSKHPGATPMQGSYQSGASGVPLWLNTSNYHVADAQGKAWSYFNQKAIAEAKKEGKPGVVIHNVWDEPNSTTNLSKPQTIYITFPEGQQTIKSKFAAMFDPKSKDISKAIVGGAGLGAGGYAMQPGDASARTAQQPQFQQPAPLSDRINQIIDSLQWQDQWQGRMRLPLERKVNNMLGESVWPPLR